MENARINFFRKWHGVQLEDWGGYRSDEYKGFERAFKRMLTSIAKDLGAKLVWFTPMHYDESAMFERNGKFVYLCHSNYISNRSTPVLHRILVRTAKHEKDYHGGPNNYPTWSQLTNEIDRLLGGNGEIENEDAFPWKQRYPNSIYDAS